MRKPLPWLLFFAFALRKPERSLLANPSNVATTQIMRTRTRLWRSLGRP
jgi:hypothetical protein